MHYQIIYNKVISDAPVTVSGSQVRKETGCREVGDSIDDVIADRCPRPPHLSESFIHSPVRDDMP